MSKKSLPQPKVVLITGAARRIGAEIARFLHKQGLRIVVHYRTSKKDAKTLCTELNKTRNNSAFALQTNLSNMSNLHKLIENSIEKWGYLDVLVNNAAVFQQTKIGKITELDWDNLITPNLKAPLFLSQAASPYLAQQKGCIIHIADIHGERPMRHYPVYSISKAGLLMLTKALARELAPRIRVNSISPGPTIWPEGKNTLSLTKKTEIIDRTALKRHGSSEAIAQAVYFLIGAEEITGQNLIIDGGRSLLV